MTRGSRGSLPAAGSSTAWRGGAVTKARQFMAAHTTWPTQCARCHRPVALADRWVVGHKVARSSHPELTWVTSNWQIECRACSDKSGQRQVIENATARALATGSSPSPTPRQAPPLFSSLSPAPTTAIDGPTSTNDDLGWDPEYLRRFVWLRDLADVPENAAPPRLMSPVDDSAMCSYGWAGCTHIENGEPAVSWIEHTQGITLRWWQRLSLVRQLEHRADGTLCFRTKVESAPRRAGKSVGLRGHALWRLEHGHALFGEPQTILHTGSDVAVCREIQRGAWRWAESQGWVVVRANGKEAVEHDGQDRWLVRAQDAVYGYDVCVGMVDEGWDVKPDTVSEGLEPATLERRSAQLVLTSTAHRRATSLMRGYIGTAMAGTDPTVLLLLWGAPVGADVSDPAVWRAASPHWSQDRANLVARKYARAEAGEADPEFDDAPMAGFISQYLNTWLLNEPRMVGAPVIEADAWSALAADLPTDVPDSCAIEAWYDRGVSVARAWRVDGRVVLSVTDHPTLDAAASYAADVGCRRAVQVGVSLFDSPTWRANRVRVESVGNSTKVSVGELLRSIREDAFRHADAQALTDQVLAMRVTDGVDGPNIRSSGRADAIKAAMWALAAGRNARSVEMVIPSRFRNTPL